VKISLEAAVLVLMCSDDLVHVAIPLVQKKYWEIKMLSVEIFNLNYA
jgi:hypothetical protein